MKTGSAEDFLGSLTPRQRIFFQGGPGEPLCLYSALAAFHGLAGELEFWACLIPGINTLDYASLPGDLRLTTFMASPALAPSMATGRTTLMAMPYSEIAALMARTSFDVAVLHVSPADNRGRHSFSLSCDMGPLVWRQAKRRVAFINAQMPWLPDSETLPADAIDLAVEIDEPLLSAPVPSQNPAAGVIAERAASLVPDGATFQSGIGDTPAAITAALRSHRGLKVYSGIITPEHKLLAENGALDPVARHVTGIAWGDAGFREWLPASGFSFRSARETHSHSRLASIANFVSIGSALEVDLSGNLNLEWRAGRRISSVGGAPDFLRGAALSRGGRSIIALQATGREGASRIVPQLTSPSIPGALADTIVTEYGVAELRGLGPAERAHKLMAISAPEHRDHLAASWRMITR